MRSPASFLLPFLAVPLLAAAPPTIPTAEEISLVQGLLISPAGETRELAILSASHGLLRFRDTTSPSGISERPLAPGETIYFPGSADFRRAMDLFQGRRYTEARPLFAQIKVRNSGVSTLPDNPSTLSGFYELECLRKSGDLEGLATSLPAYNSGALTRAHQLRQLEMYIFWDAARTKSWPRLLAMAEDRSRQRLPAYQRAQVAYCKALALQGSARPDEALEAYNIALTADLGGSEEIARPAALAILQLHKADPDVMAALKQPAGASPRGITRLREAAAIATFFEDCFGSGSPLPEDLRVFLKAGK